VIAFLRRVGYTDQRWIETNTDALDLWERPQSHLIARV
jgi:hypothetical protein